MPNITQITREVNVDNLLVLCFDVSKDRLDGFAEHVDPSGQTVYELVDQCPNRVRAIERKIGEFAGYARQVGLKGLHVVCEPTGGHERKLLRAARRLGHTTAYVNSEFVAKASVIESGDPGKTDRMDARVISMIAKIDKTQEDRVLVGEYLLLRELGKIYHAENKLLVQAKNRIHDLLKELFCDYGKSKEFTFLRTGQAMMECYHWNPQRVVDDGFERFEKTIKREVKRVRRRTLEELWAQAQTSARQLLPGGYQKMLEERLAHLWADYQRHQERKDRLKEQMGALYRKLHSEEKVPDRIEQLSWSMMGRIIGETGPLEDFDHWRQLLHYAGLNIRERKSGKYIGQNKITKKGRPLLRKALYDGAFQLLRQDRLFGPYYHQKRAGGMAAKKAQVAVMRKLVKLIYGLYRSGNRFDRERVFACESRRQRAA